MPCPSLHPDAIADPGRRLRCPDPGCRRPVHREPLAAQRGEQRIQATCTALDCAFRQVIGIAADGSVRTIAESELAAPPPDRHGFDASVAHMNRGSAKRSRGPGRCMVPGCALAINGHGLCSTHYSRWVNLGRPDQESAAFRAWLEARGPTPTQWRRMREGLADTETAETPETLATPALPATEPDPPADPSAPDAAEETECITLTLELSPRVHRMLAWVAQLGPWGDDPADVAQRIIYEQLCAFLPDLTFPEAES